MIFPASPIVTTCNNFTSPVFACTPTFTKCTEKEHITEGLQALYAEGLKNTEWHDRLSITQALKTLTSFLQDKENTLKKSGDTVGEKETSDLRTAAEKYMNDLKKNEKDEELIKIYQSGK